MLARSILTIDVVDYMANGAGRFAKIAMFEMVANFFIAPPPPGEYTKVDLNYHYNMDDEYALYIGQSNYRDEKDDYAERTFVFNSTSFKMSESTRFVVTQEGDVYIKNVGVEPYVDNAPENFDFEGGGLAAWLLNPVVENLVDPSAIGRKVILDFNYDNGPISTSERYDWDDFQDELGVVFGWGGLAPLKLVSDGYELIEELFDSGVIKYLDENNRPIIYGTLEDDLSLTPANGMNVFLAEYVENGVVILAALATIPCAA